MLFGRPFIHSAECIRRRSCKSICCGNGQRNGRASEPSLHRIPVANVFKRPSTARIDEAADRSAASHSDATNVPKPAITAATANAAPTARSANNTRSTATL